MVFRHVSFVSLSSKHPKKREQVNDLLFRLNTLIDPISLIYNIGDQYLGLILKVFRRKDSFLERFELYIG